MRDMQQLRGTRKESGRQPAKMGDSDRHAVTPCDWRDSERQPATIQDDERHTAIPWDRRVSERQLETIKDM